MADHKMIDLKMTKTEQKRRDTGMPVAERDRYPWGTALDLDSAHIKKLDLGDKNAGDMVEIHAIGKITRVNVKDEGKSDQTKNMSIQIQKIEITSPENANKKVRKDVEKEVYGG